jgi:hypothetical protein
MVLENSFNYLKEVFHAEEKHGFSSAIEENETEFHKRTHLAKLHGSIDTKVIVPPTWNKGLHREIKPAWKLAYKLLTEANQIRIVGYSLPVADAYVKYMLKAAIIKCENLKRIDVICRDNESHDVEKRYAQFIRHPNYAFKNDNVVNYLQELNDLLRFTKVSGNDIVYINKLESAHKNYFKEEK